MTKWSIAKARERFNIDHWSEGYFDIDANGEVVCRPCAADNNAQWPLKAVAEAAVQAGLGFPVLIRFQDILTHRVRNLCDAFDKARAKRGYTARHTAVYPIKVNQQRCVVEQISQAYPGRVGLEAGSKPELMAILAQTFYRQDADDHDTLICNGYKDREYIRLALIGRQLGKRIFIVIEQVSELETVLREAAALGIEPLLGIRMRLASIGKGKWQNTGGELGKFGMSATQLLAALDKLRAANSLQHLKLLHFHMGSQIADLDDIRAGVSESARIYAELHQLGAAIEVLDIGGGLGIDYDGTQSVNEFSINYRAEDYAEAVINTVADVCAKHHLPTPEIITESGRALTAHHAVLVTNVVDVEKFQTHQTRPEINSAKGAQPHSIVVELDRLYEQADAALGPDEAVAVLQLAKAQLRFSHTQFNNGTLNLLARAEIERFALALFYRIRDKLADSGRHLEIFEELNQKLADKYFCNFSVFQSVPDVWGLGQTFPILPLSRLQEPLTQHAILHDMTCDSDGQIKEYVDNGVVRKTMPLHAIKEDETYLIGIFLTGAYQEILGDIHNLFGDTHSINVSMTENGQYRLAEPEPGDRIDELLRYVHYDTEKLLQQYRAKLDATNLSTAIKAQYFHELESGLSGYTYLED
ncbi:MAG: biosynthetic arginine decarboxylase [Gammaproteobacteria bacterium]|nr:biosynthetic arginine decarboxylase [Gammaproteobacteria bacterium]